MRTSKTTMRRHLIAAGAKHSPGSGRWYYTTPRAGIVILGTLAEAFEALDDVREAVAAAAHNERAAALPHGEGWR